MAIETERKFLVRSDAWRDRISGETRITQGYIAFADAATVRVRIGGTVAWVTIKGRPSARSNLSRLEFEYPIPLADADQMLTEMAHGLVEKTRFVLDSQPGVWTVDVFLGQNLGLTVLEIEGDDVLGPLQLPDWVGNEVSTEPRYANEELALHPFATWDTP